MSDVNQTPELKKPWMVAVWPGMGHVATTAGFSWPIRRRASRGCPFHPLRGKRLVFLYRETLEEDEWVFLQGSDRVYFRIPVEWRTCVPVTPIRTYPGGMFRFDFRIW